MSTIEELRAEVEALKSKLKEKDEKIQSFEKTNSKDTKSNIPQER